MKINEPQTNADTKSTENEPQTNADTKSTENEPQTNADTRRHFVLPALAEQKWYPPKGGKKGIRVWILTILLI